MQFHDTIYGSCVVDSHIINDLINSHPIQRLKGISQFGIPDDYYHLKNYTRFDHSIGVMLLLKHLGASEEEQIAGLLHDVSHTAFSHVVDWVVGEGKTENFQDEHHASYIRSTEIPTILHEHGYNVTRIIDYHHFGLLERDLPDLCADRVDYSLREFSHETTKHCFEDLTTADGHIVFKTQATALLFAQSFLNRQREHWGGFEAVTRYRIFANMLQYALKNDLVTMQDFWQDDSFVISKLQQADDKTITKTFALLRNKSLDHLPKSDTIAHKKFRFVDPLILHGDTIVRLSEVNNAFKKTLQKARDENEKGITLPEIESVQPYL